MRPVRLRFPPLIAWPVIFWFVAFLLVPVAMVAAYSFSTKGVYGGVDWTQPGNAISNFSRSLEWVYLKIFWNSVKLATLTSISCLVIGYPMAYWMSVVSKPFQRFLMVLVVVPFWTNFVVRAYALKIVLSESGFLSQWMVSKGWVAAPFSFATGDLSVWLGMVTNYLPFMVLPLYATLEKFDFSLLEASRDLGASSWHVMTRILFPLTLPGVITGFIFVFTPALGEFVIPDLLGGARTMLIGNLITEQFLKTRDWPFGSALSLLLIGLVFLSLLLYLRFGDTTERKVVA